MAKYFPPELVDKALWVIQHESGGNPGAVGDGGAARGLFQIQDKRNFASRPDAAYLDNPENNIKYAAQVLGAAKGKWSDWGEGSTYQGKKFGALGNHPYPGGAVNGRASIADSLGNTGGTSMPDQGTTDPMAALLEQLLGGGGGGGSTPSQPAWMTQIGSKIDSLYEAANKFIQAGKPVPPDLKKQIQDAELIQFAANGLGIAGADSGSQNDYPSQLNSFANLLGTAVSMGNMRANAAADKIKGYNDQYEAGLVSPTGYQHDATPGSFMRNALGAWSQGDAAWQTAKQDRPDPNDPEAAASSGYQDALSWILGQAGQGQDQGSGSDMSWQDQLNFDDQTKAFQDALRNAFGGWINQPKSIPNAALGDRDRYAAETTVPWAYSAAAAGQGPGTGQDDGGTWFTHLLNSATRAGTGINHLGSLKTPTSGPLGHLFPGAPFAPLVKSWLPF